MRSLLLASAAMIISAGIAGAQTASPAPTGAPSAPVMNSPGMSPGNTAPAPSPSSGMAPADTGKPTASPMTNSGSSGSMMTPPTSGSTMSNAPNMSPGAATNTAPPEKMKPSMGSMMLPADADAGTYLKMAKGAMKHHNKMMADDALSHAETRLLDRAVPAGGIMPDSSPAISSIGMARKALAKGDMKGAMKATDMAMQQSMMPAQ